MNHQNRLAASSISALVVALSFSAAASAAPPVKLHCFGDGECTVSANTASLSNDSGEFSGVYLKSRSTSGKYLSRVSFSFVSTGDVAGGAPRFSIPISLSGNHSVDAYAFLDVNGCGGAPLVSTDSDTCAVYFGAETFANWAAFAAAYPTAMVAPGGIPFVIADQPGNYSVQDIVLR